VTSVFEWAEKHGTPYTVRKPVRQGQVFAAEYGQLTVPLGFPYLYPESYVAEIPNAIVSGHSDSIWADGEEINDLAAYHERRYPLATATGGHALAPVPTRDPLSVTLPDGVMLLHQFSPFYFHLIVEQLSRLSLLDDGSEPLMLDRDWPYQAIEALRQITSRPIFRVHAGAAFLVERLIVPSRLVMVPPDLRPPEQTQFGDYLIPKEVVDFLRGLAKPSFRENGSTSSVEPD